MPITYPYICPNGHPGDSPTVCPSCGYHASEGRGPIVPTERSPFPAKVRITARVWSFLEGTGAGQSVIDLRRDGSTTTREQAVAEAGSEADVRLIEKILDAPGRKDGSCTIVVETADEAFGLDLFADVMAQGARDNIGSDPWALADYNAATALRRQLDPLMVGVQRW